MLLDVPVALPLLLQVELLVEPLRLAAVQVGFVLQCRLHLAEQRLLLAVHRAARAALERVGAAAQQLPVLAAHAHVALAVLGVRLGGGGGGGGSGGGVVGGAQRGGLGKLCVQAGRVLLHPLQVALLLAQQVERVLVRRAHPNTPPLPLPLLPLRRRPRHACRHACRGLRPRVGRAGPGVAPHQAAARGRPLLLLLLLLELRVAPVELAHDTLRREQPHPQLLLGLHPPRTRARPCRRRRLQVLSGHLQGGARRGHRAGRRLEAPRVLGVGRGQPPQLVELAEGRLVLLGIERRARVGRLRPIGRLWLDGPRRQLVVQVRRLGPVAVAVAVAVVGRGPLGKVLHVPHTRPTLPRPWLVHLLVHRELCREARARLASARRPLHRGAVAGQGPRARAAARPLHRPLWWWEHVGCGAAH